MTMDGIMNSLLLWVDFAVVVVNFCLFRTMRRWGRDPEADRPARSEQYAAANDWRLGAVRAVEPEVKA
jgi:hypothetical protein